MDKDEIQFPKEFLAEGGRRHLMGLRYHHKWGGRDLSWVDTYLVMEEVGTLGYIFSCIEPRGGSDFFGSTTTAVLEGDNWILNGTLLHRYGPEFFLNNDIKLQISLDSIDPEINNKTRPKLRVKKLIDDHCRPA